MLPSSLCARCSRAARAGVAAQVTAWLDEEWAPLPVHAELGRATAAGYSRLRAAGGRDVTDMLLGLSTELMPFNFKETFTGPFEVGGTGKGGARGNVHLEATPWDFIPVCCTVRTA